MDGMMVDLEGQCFHKGSLLGVEPIVRPGPGYMKPGP